MKVSPIQSGLLLALGVASAIAAAETSAPPAPQPSVLPNKSLAGLITPAPPFTERENEKRRRSRHPRYLLRPDTTDGAIAVNFEDLECAQRDNSGGVSLMMPPLEKLPNAHRPWRSSRDKGWRDIPEQDDRRVGIYPGLYGDDIQRLNGRRIAIRGFIHPASAPVEQGLTKFILVHEDQTNGFSSYQVDETIVVEMLPGRTADFSTRPIMVVGKLTVKQSIASGQTWSLFRIDAESAERSDFRKPADGK